MPVLSEILSSIKIHGGVYFCDRLEPPWKIDQEVDYSAGFHYIRSGQCWVEFNGDYDLAGPGDLIFIGHGGQHSLASYKDAPTENDFAGAAHLLCGYFNFRDPLPFPLNEAVPEVMIVRAGDIAELPWLKLTLEHLSSEYDTKTPGSSVVINKLTEVVLVELIRFHLKGLSNNNYVAALFDPQIGKALEFIHTQPQENWTLESLASEVAMSRAVFAKRFKLLVGETMFQYLTSVRMRMASDLLRHSHKRVEDIAEQVGYSSDMAFGKVFKDQFGSTPYAWRKAYRESLINSAG